MRRLDGIVEKLRENKALFKSLIVDLPGLRFRELPDPAGDLATHLVVFFPSAAIAQAVTGELGSRTLADSGWHIYSKMEHLLNKRTASGRGCPFDCRCHFDEPVEYHAGMLPQTDAQAAGKVFAEILENFKESTGQQFSVGIASLQEGDSLADLVSRADQHLYTRKGRFGDEAAAITQPAPKASKAGFLARIVRLRKGG